MNYEQFYYWLDGYTDSYGDNSSAREALDEIIEKMKTVYLPSYKGIPLTNCI